ncbi:hypothetical protein F4814DRAFT_421322 [Daldinia grandis]|nr:hypothetical protein F4814DRAFT_421322 [Daldinia grandis]
MAERKPSTANPRSRSAVDNDPQARLPSITDLNLNLNLRSAAPASSPFSLTPRYDTHTVLDNNIHLCTYLPSPTLTFDTSIHTYLTCLPTSHLNQPTLYDTLVQHNQYHFIIFSLSRIRSDCPSTSFNHFNNNHPVAYHRSSFYRISTSLSIVPSSLALRRRYV